MLEKGIKSIALAKEFRVTNSAIYMALAGKRQRLLERISAYVKLQDGPRRLEYPLLCHSPKLDFQGRR